MKGFCGYLSGVRKMRMHSTGAGCLTWSCFEQGPVPGELRGPIPPALFCQPVLESRGAIVRIPTDLDILFEAC